MCCNSDKCKLNVENIHKLSKSELVIHISELSKALAVALFELENRPKVELVLIRSDD